MAKMTEQEEKLYVLRYGLESSKLLLGLSTYEQMESADPDLIRKGRDFLKKREEIFQSFIERHILDLKSTIAVDYRIAVKGVFTGRGDKNPEKVQAYARVLSAGFVKLATEKSKISSMSEGQRDISQCIKSFVSSATDEGVAFDRVCTIPKVKGGPSFPRKWLGMAAATIQESSTEEQLITDIQGALESAEKLQDAQARITSGVGDPEENDQDKASALREIKEVADSSGDPSAVIGAVASALGTTSSHRSEVGKRLGLNAEQEDAMLVSGKAIIAAGAGSGKTRVLAGKIVHLLESGVAPDQIIASSFTRKSAMELKERVVKYGGSQIELNDAGFGTTHSISKKILNTVEPGYLANKMLIEDDTLIREAMLQVSLLPDEATEPFRGPVSYKDDEIITEELSAEDLVLQAIVEGALGIVSYSRQKSGLRAWSRGDLNLFEPLKGKKVSELTSGQKTALNNYLENTNRGEKMLGRLSKLFPSVDANYRIASISDDVKKLEQVEGAEDKEGGVKPVNQWFNIGEKSKDVSPKKALLHVSKMKAEMISWSEAWDAESSYENAVYGAYEWLKNERNMIDHEDYMIRCIQALVQSPKRLAQIQEQFKYVLIDEAQDLNRTQHVLFGLIAGAYDPETFEMRQDGSMSANTYCFIGDDKQAIYEFRGANPDTFTNNSDLRDGAFKTKLITNNFRSGKNIVNAANQLIAYNDKQIPMQCRAQDVRGEGAIKSMSVDTPMQGAKFAVEAIKRDMAEDGGLDMWKEDYPKYGVAARTNAELADYILHCVAEDIKFSAKPGINPFKNKVYEFLFTILDVGGDGTPLNRSIYKMKDFFDFGLDAQFGKYLKAQSKASREFKSVSTYFFQDGTPVVYTAKTHKFRNDQFVVPYRNTLLRLRALVKGSPTIDLLINDLLEVKITDSKNVTYSVKDYLNILNRLEASKQASTLDGKESGSQQLSNDKLEEMTNEIVSIFRKLLSNGDTVEESIEFVNRIRGKATKLNVRDEDRSKAVVLDTCHGWKGLEAKHVWIPMESGKFPADAREDENPNAKLASERRLAYVALTRGRDSVTIINPRRDSKGIEYEGESRFLAEACIRPMEGALPYAQDDAPRTKGAKVASDRSLVHLVLNDDLTDTDFRNILRRKF
jgi:superfamily I DNA/RNA helicase